MQTYKTNFKLDINYNNNSFQKNFFEIIVIFVLSILPIIMHNILPLLNPYGDEVKNLLTSQAIGFFQPMSFFTVNITILCVVSVISRLKWSLNKVNRQNQPKNIIDTGLIFVLIMSFALALIFFIVMFSYSESRVNSGHIYHKENIGFILENNHIYIGNMMVYIIISALVCFFYFLLIECGVNFTKVIILTIVFGLFENITSYILTFYTNANMTFTVIFGSIICKIIQLCVYWIILKCKITSWVFRKFQFDKKIFKGFFKSISFLGIFMLAYGLLMFSQMVLITHITSKSNFAYLISKDDLYALIFARLTVYNIFNILVCIPKSAARSILLTYKKTDSIPLTLKNEEQARQYCFYAIYALALSGLIIFFCLDGIVDSMFGGTLLSSEPINGMKPAYLNHINSYAGLIKVFVYQSFIIGLVAQILINLGIIFRILTYFFYGREYKSFTLTIISFVVILCLGNYFLGFYWQDIFTGIMGFVLALLIYGLISLSIILCYYKKIKVKIVARQNSYCV